MFKTAYNHKQSYEKKDDFIAVSYTHLKPHDKILSMSLKDGGHLSHGNVMNISGRYYEIHFYNVDRETEQIDYENIRKMAKEIRPKLIIAGASSYPRIIDFKKFREIADETGAYLMADIAHIAGLIADVYKRQLDLGWKLLSVFPKTELKRIRDEFLEKYLPLFKKETDDQKSSEKGIGADNAS